MKIALRQAANAIGNLKDTDLSNFRRGRMAAVTPTARKLATILWNMLSKKIPYTPTKEYLLFNQKRNALAFMNAIRYILKWIKMKIVSKIKKEIIKLDLTSEDLGLKTTW